MDYTYPVSSLLARLLEEVTPWTADLDAHLVLDLPTGYALAAARSLPRPCLIITDNQCPLYLHDLWELQLGGLIAAGDGFDLEQISQALAEVAAGIPVYLGPPLNDTVLTDRERDVVRLAALGCDNREIARELHLTEKRVRNTLAGVLPKLGLKNRVELSHYYLGTLEFTRNVMPGQSPG